MSLVAADLADLGVRRRRQHLIVDGERGDYLSVATQRSASVREAPHFHCNMVLCPVAYVAWQRRSTLEAVRGSVYKPGDEFIYDRLPTWGWPPGVWEVSEATMETVAANLVHVLRPVLIETWLPLLPRAGLLAALNEHPPKLPGLGVGDVPLARRLVGIEDVPPADRVARVIATDGDDAELVAWARLAFGGAAGGGAAS